jgi:hypothetical protein
MVWSACALAGTWSTADALRADDRFAPPTVAERATYAALVRDLLRDAERGQLPASLGERAADLGFALSVSGEIATLAEIPDRRRGAGLVAVRLGPLDREVVLQAPHPYHDRGTGALAGGLFDAGGFRAVTVATANRSAAPGADVAHAPESWFQAATDGAAQALQQPLFFQIHGFAASTSDACAVLSEGPTRLAPASLRGAATTLGVALACDPVRTGDEVPALAARSNVQGLLLIDRAAFLHLELSPAVRETLADDPTAASRLAGAIRALAPGGPP